MKWKLPGWDDARRTEKQAEKSRDDLDPSDFSSKAEYRRAWNAADAKLQAAWRERSGLEDDTVE